MTDTGWDAEFAAFFTARASALRSTAFLLCGDWHRAEDIIQTAFLKLYQVWPRLADRDTLDGYVRRVIVRTFLHENRRLWRHREHVTDEPPELAAAAPDVAQQVVVRAALAGVPPKQRATLVLRYWSDLSVAETATALGCSVGTVKSQSARGLVELRRRLGSAFHELFPGEAEGSQSHA